MPHPLVGKAAPPLSLPDANGETYVFTPGTTGKPVALFFYPKSGSFGCTKEACQFRDSLSSSEVYKGTGVTIIGVSPDPVEKQKAFVEKEGLTYPILSDVKGEARKAYHVGKGLLGLAESARVTFFIDSKGVVRDVCDSGMNFAAHSKFVTKWLEKHQLEEKQNIEAPTPATETASAAPAAPEAVPTTQEAA